MSELVRSTRCRSWITLMTLIAAMFGFAGLVFADASTNHVIAKIAPPLALSDDDPTNPSGDNQTQSGNLTNLAAPSNDSCTSGPIPALALYRVIDVDTTGAADDYQTPATAACYPGIGQTPTLAPGRDVVFSFTAPPGGGSYTFSIIQTIVTTDLANQNEVLYVSDSCPAGGTVNCIQGANRPTTRAFVSATGTSNNQSEQVSCVPMSGGQTYYVFFDDGRAGNNGGPGAGIEVRDCSRETEPNNTPATANAIACGIQGSSDVAPSAHCHLGFRGSADPTGRDNLGRVCTRSTPLDQSLPNSNTRCSIAGNPCSWDPATGVDTCLAGEGHCEQLTDLDCDPHCTGGPNDGKVCSTNAFCNPGSAQNATCSGQCTADFTCVTTATGLDTGVSCTPICVGGTFAGRYCGALSNCDGGGGTCTTSAACPSGSTCGRQFNEGDPDFFSLGVVPTGNKIFAGLDAKAANDTDFRMRITTTTNTLQFDDDDGVSRNGSLAPEIAGAPGTGTAAFVKISRTAFRQSEPYLLYSIVQGVWPTNAQLESETGPVGNDIYFGWPGDVLNANAIDNTVGGKCGYVRGLFNGTHGGFNFDSDCFKFLVNEGDLMSWYGDGEPARITAANTQFPQPIIYDADNAGISNFIFGANARKNTLTANATLNGLSPAVTSTFFQWRATYTGMLEVCYYDAAVPLGLGTPGNGNWAGSLDVNCGPLRCGTTTTDVGVVKTIIDGDGKTGTLLQYQIKITNSSSDIAQEVHLQDVLAPNLSFVSLTVDDGFAGGNTTCTTTDGFQFLSGLPTPGTADAPIDCINTSMAPGTVTTYVLTVQVNNCIGAGIDIANTATISTASTDPDPSNDSSTVTFTTTEDGSCQDLLCDASSCVVNACRNAGTCNGGVCETTAVNCDDDSVCTEDTCDPTTGCINDPTNIGDLCDDFNDCTSNTCVPRQIPGGPPPGCFFPPVAPGTGCSDGLTCTGADACDCFGNCVGVSVCDDGNACSDDFADESNACACSHAPSFPGTPCNDGNACTGGPVPPCSPGSDACDGAGACAGGPAVNCDDGNACTADSCNPATGCVHTPITCDDGNACNGVETCNPASGCVAGTPLVCDNGNACDGLETCNPASGCVAGTPPVCNDGNACNGVETCNPASGCVAGTPLACDDGNACNGVETCNPASGCVGGTPLVCNNNDACDGLETCNPASGCVAGTPLVCNNGNACDGLEICNPASGCVAGTPVVCAPAGQCQTAGVCAPATGLCSYGNKPDGTTCDDGNAACSPDTCTAGVCGCTSCTSTHDPKTKGWYRHLCSHNHHGDSITDADAACVGSISDTFAGITTKSQVCHVLDGSHDFEDEARRSSCSKAEDQLMALALNICKHRVCPSDGIDSHCDSNGHDDDLMFHHNNGGHDDDDDGDDGIQSTVGASFDTADGLLDNPSRTSSECKVAECLAKEINNGRALEFSSVVAAREGSNLRLRWLAPILNDGTATPTSYKIWRRDSSSTAPFVQIGSTAGLTYLDVTGGTTTSWEFDVTAVMPADND